MNNLIKNVLDYKNEFHDEKWISVEDYNKDFFKSKELDIYTDVLYSALSLYVLGLYACYKDNYYLNNDGLICYKGKDGEEYLIYNRRYVLENFEKFTELNQIECVKKFFDNYYELGNLIYVDGFRMNNERGIANIYDSPEIYFHNNKEKTLDFLNNNIYNEYPQLKSDIYPIHFITQNKITSVKDLYFDTKEDYIDYVNYVNDIITKRTEFYKSL